MIEIDRAEFDVSMRRLLGDLELGARKAVHDGVEAAAESARRTTLYKDQTGATRASLRTEQVGDYSARLVSGKATRFLENGTAPHPIDAKNAPRLVFKVNGAWRSALHVDHPGTTARPFMAEASRLGERAMEFSLDTHANDAIARSG